MLCPPEWLSLQDTQEAGTHVRTHEGTRGGPAQVLWREGGREASAVPAAPPRLPPPRLPPPPPLAGLFPPRGPLVCPECWETATHLSDSSRSPR